MGVNEISMGFNEGARRGVVVKVVKDETENSLCLEEKWGDHESMDDKKNSELAEGRNTFNRGNMETQISIGEKLTE